MGRRSESKNGPKIGSRFRFTSGRTIGSQAEVQLAAGDIRDVKVRATRFLAGMPYLMAESWFALFFGISANARRNLATCGAGFGAAVAPQTGRTLIPKSDHLAAPVSGP